MEIVYLCERCDGEIRLGNNLLEQPCRACLMKELGQVRGKLQRVRDWIKFAANSEAGIVDEIDMVLCDYGVTEPRIYQICKKGTR